MERRSVEHRSATGRKPMRESHMIAAPLLCFDFAEELEGLKAERPYREQDRNAKTLVKSKAFRLVLVALKVGARFEEDDPRGYVSLLVRQGHVSLHVGDESTEVGTSQIAAIATGHRWWAIATEDSVVVLHLSWPG